LRAGATREKSLRYWYDNIGRGAMACRATPSDDETSLCTSYRALRQMRNTLKRVGDRQLTGMVARCGVVLSASYHYNLAASGIARILGDDALRQINSLNNGDPLHNRLACLGSERI
jgi:hypothetical protein